MAENDPRRLIPRTDTLLAHPAVQETAATMSSPVISRVIHTAQERARTGELAPAEVEAEVLAALAAHGPSSLRPVINATGVIIHTNLGRAPLSASARKAVAEASGYVDVEMDLSTGSRSRRGAGARQALLGACPPAEDALIVNNGAAALALATTALAGTNEVVISRGELVEIGAGFRLPDLIASTGAQLREVGTTNRTHQEDYADAVGAATGCVVKVHPSNYWISGFTSDVSVAELSRLCREHGLPLIVDVGSGLLAPDPTLPEEPDLGSALTEGADLVIASGDKLLGGPQAGLILGRASVVSRLARHPLARAMRTDKLTLAALEATLSAEEAPVLSALHTDPDVLHRRTTDLAEAIQAEVVPHDGRVGGGGGAGVPLPGWAVQLPEAAAAPLRAGQPAVVPRLRDSACLLDLRCVPEAEDPALLNAAQRALQAVAAGADAGQGVRPPDAGL